MVPTKGWTGQDLEASADRNECGSSVPEPCARAGDRVPSIRTQCLPATRPFRSGVFPANNECMPPRVRRRGPLPDVAGGVLTIRQTSLSQLFRGIGNLTVAVDVKGGHEADESLRPAHSSSREASSRPLRAECGQHGIPTLGGAREPRRCGEPSMSVRTQFEARGAAVGRRIRTTPVAWLGHADLTVDEWQSFGPRIGLVSKSTNWWLGDWVRFGQRHYDQRYQRASELTGYDEQTLMNLAYVAGRFEISRRREAVPWSHHAELAKLEIVDQEVWLDRAMSQRLSVRKLRTELRSTERAAASSGTSDSAGPANVHALKPEPAWSIVCPHCGGAFPAERVIKE